MSKFIINGGKNLKGEIEVSGSKNAVLACMAACLLTDEPCRLTNVPMIGDVMTMAEIIRDLGVKVEVRDHEVLIEAKNLVKTNLNPELVSKLRGSILLVGPLVGRARKVSLPHPGGDKIGVRPIDTHIAALKDLGVEVKVGEVVEFNAQNLQGSKIVLEETSVTATENAMMAASLATDKTVIRLAAMEPHVQCLGAMLEKMGAKISGFGTPTIIIEGVKKLSGVDLKIIADGEEAASFITLAAATKSHIKISKLNSENLEDYLLKLRKMNVNFAVNKDSVEVFEPKSDYQATKIQCGFYPKLNSDFMPPMAVLATQAQGESLFDEWMYESRLGYVPELNKMGANVQVLDPHRVKITGPTPLHSAKITSYDLRMGITLVIAALTASGESEIEGVEHVDRGYENLEERLSAIGADIKRED